MDKLSQLVGQLGLSANVFFNGAFCDSSEFHEDGMHGHLHIIRQGVVIFTHRNGKKLEVSEPTIVFYPRGENHRVNVPHGESVSLICATVTYENGARNSLAKLLPECVHLLLKNIPAMHRTLDILFVEAATPGPGSAIILNRLFDVLATQLIRHVCDQENLTVGLLAGLTDTELAPVLGAIHESAHLPWQLPALAKVAGMSRSAFAEHFRKVVGTTPAAYLMRWRITLAQRLLQSGIPVKVVSERVGYRSPSIFTRAFSNEVGKPPRKWARDHGLAPLS